MGAPEFKGAFDVMLGDDDGGRLETVGKLEEFRGALGAVTALKLAGALGLAFSDKLPKVGGRTGVDCGASPHWINVGGRMELAEGGEIVKGANDAGAARGAIGLVAVPNCSLGAAGHPPALIEDTFSGA